MIESYEIIHGLYDTAVAPSLIMSQVSHIRGNMHKLPENSVVTTIEVSPPPRWLATIEPTPPPRVSSVLGNVSGDVS